ncbi:MAG: tRNA threonylcarbamoyladenosine dehydratase [Tangfeifania sp.]
MSDWLDRTNLLIGPENLEKLKAANVLVVGLGGVGAVAAEMICRAGVGKMTIADGDVVETTNRNRQLPALKSTEGRPKTEILAKRLLDINPGLELNSVFEFIRDERAVELLSSQSYDYVVDAIDTLSPKVFLIHHSLELGLNLVSSMGAGGKVDPSKVAVTDISKSYNCKLARMIRKRLNKLGIKKGFKVVFSPEEVDENAIRLEESQNKKSSVGTISYMPAVFGCFAASVVIRDLAE